MTDETITVDHGGWLREVPDTWRVGPLRRFCSITLGKMVSQIPAKDGELARPYLRAAHVQPNGQLVLADIKLMAFTKDETTRLRLSRGDVVVVEGGAGFGRSAVLREDLDDWGFQNSINRVRPFDGEGRFLNYVLLAAQASGHFETLINTATIPHLTAEKLAEVQVAWPDFVLQNLIADFLDARAAKIDALIEKQERLIETLAERRQAAVNHAVTKGLDPTAPMKDSGFQAIGRIPSHWDVSPLRHVIRSVKSGTSVNALDVEPDDGEIGVLKTSCVSTGNFDVRQAKSVDPDELGRVACPVEANRLIVSRMNTPALVGAAGLTRHAAPRTFLPDRLWQVEFTHVEPEFVHSWTQTPAYRDQVSIVCVGTSSSMQNLSQSDFRSFLLPLPPLDEQLKICRFLKRETGQIDALTVKAREMIDVLKERRQALINAAVTGKIDVRGLS